MSSWFYPILVDTGETLALNIGYAPIVFIAIMTGVFVPMIRPVVKNIGTYAKFDDFWYDKKSALSEYAWLAFVISFILTLFTSLFPLIPLILFASLGIALGAIWIAMRAIKGITFISFKAANKKRIKNEQ